MNLYPSLWGSITALTNEIITEMAAAHPEATIQFVDWEAHANIEELPDVDLIGPTALTFMEITPEMWDVNFSIAASTYKSDENLFRMRHYMSHVFERLRPTRQVQIYDDLTAERFGYLVVTDGTGLMPMTRSTTRPWQYVQVNGLLEPGLI